MSASTDQSPEKLISLSELGRLCNISVTRTLAYYNAGLFGVPDFKTNNAVCWRADRVDAIRESIKDYGLPKAVKANTARQRK